MLKIYNSLTKKKEPFVSLMHNCVKIYVCGPTVYDHLHVGNIRPIIFFDMLKHYFNVLGFKVRLVMNVTDIDDKIIDKSIEQKITEKQIVSYYTTAFVTLLKKLNIDTIDDMPFVTQYINDIINYISELKKKGYTYSTKEGIYFRINLVENYGELSKQDLNKLRKNIRQNVATHKANFEDFVLWKRTSKGIQYPSPWFDGRPGWHTECVVMIKKLFHTTIDIHGGGNDLKFPHHENEQAQFWASENQPLAKFFIHVGHVYYQQKKMSKSLGNVILVKDILDEIDANAIKLFFLSCSYLQPINYSYSNIQKFQLKYTKILYHLNKNNFQLLLNNIDNQELLDHYIQKFHVIMSDNLQTSNVITLIEALLKEMHIQHECLVKLAKLQNTLIYLLNSLGIKIVLKKLTLEKRNIYYSWIKARKNKDFDKADKLRIILQKENII
ncbi:MAG: cysteine--tRNA ligase [Vigna little leaf phytoplasma]|nr:cysteine--tRNA ligase [Vigna little leaf phytoplasma]